MQSRLYGSQQSDADEYADLFDVEVTRTRTGNSRAAETVSYTHLTLPTIYSV